KKGRLIFSGLPVPGASRQTRLTRCAMPDRSRPEGRFLLRFSREWREHNASKAVDLHKVYAVEPMRQAESAAKPAKFRPGCNRPPRQQAQHGPGLKTSREGDPEFASKSRCAG